MNNVVQYKQDYSNVIAENAADSCFLITTVCFFTETYFFENLKLQKAMISDREEIYLRIKLSVGKAFIYSQERMREIQGAICVSAIFQVFIGYSGVQP